MSWLRSVRAPNASLPMKFSLRMRVFPPPFMWKTTERVVAETVLISALASASMNPFCARASLISDSARQIFLRSSGCPTWSWNSRCLK